MTYRQHLDPLFSAAATPRTRRHIFWGLMHVFRWQYMTFALMHVLEAIAQFLTPIGINRLLQSVFRHDLQCFRVYC